MLDLTASSVRLNCRQHRSLDSVIGSWRGQGANQRLRLGTRREFIHIHILANSQRARTSWRRATTPNSYNTDHSTLSSARDGDRGRISGCGLARGESSYTFTSAPTLSARAHHGDARRLQTGTTPITRLCHRLVTATGGESAAAAWHAARVHTLSHPRQLSARAHIMASRDDSNQVQHRSLDSVIGSWRRQGANQRLRLGTRREFIHIHILANSQRARTSWRRATTPNRYNLKLWKECPPDTGPWVHLGYHVHHLLSSFRHILPS